MGLLLASTTHEFPLRNKRWGLLCLLRVFFRRNDDFVHICGVEKPQSRVIVSPNILDHAGTHRPINRDYWFCTKVDCVPGTSTSFPVIESLVKQSMLASYGSTALPSDLWTVTR
jgi:hypothetical protein